MHTNILPCSWQQLVGTDHPHKGPTLYAPSPSEFVCHWKREVKEVKCTQMACKLRVFSEIVDRLAVGENQGKLAVISENICPWSTDCKTLALDSSFILFPSAAKSIWLSDGLLLLFVFYSGSHRQLRSKVILSWSQL